MSYKLEKVTDANGTITLLNGSKAGLGMQIRSNGEYFHGEFASSSYHGKGYLNKNDVKYYGEFVYGIMNGFGQLVTDSEVYLGEIKKGSKSGCGIIKNQKNHQISKGRFKDGLLNGFSIIAQPNLDYIYKGYMEKNCFNGIGSEQRSDSVYLGHFVDDQKSGVGLYTMSDKSFYLGHWFQDLKCKYGIQHHQNGDKFEGEFKMDQMSGLGRYFDTQEGSTYTGTFDYNKRSGFGRLESSEYIFVGSWENGEKNGLGYQSVTQGGSYFGYWKDGLRHGIGYEIGKDYDYKGEWKDDVPHGYAILSVKNKGQRTAKFNNGQIENYLKGNLDELAARFDDMNFDQFFQNSRKKLVLIDDYIEKERNSLENHYEKIRTDFAEEEATLENQIQSVVKYIESLRKEIDNNYQQLLVMMKEQGLSLQDLSKTDYSPSKFEKFNKADEFRAYPKSEGKFLNPVAIGSASLPRSARVDRSNNDIAKFDDSNYAQIPGLQPDNLFSDKNVDKTISETPITQRALDNIREESARIKSLRAELQQEYDNLQMEEANLQTNKLRLNSTINDLQDKRADKEKKKMELFFLKKQVIEETQRLQELKNFLEQNVAESSLQESKKDEKITEIEKYQQRLKEKKEYLQRVEAENRVEEEQIQNEKAQLEKDRMTYID